MEIRSLHSRFARRIFLLFLLAALLPILALYGLTYVGISGQLEQQSARALEDSAKNRGMEVLQHLQWLKRELKWLGQKLETIAETNNQEKLKVLDDSIGRRFLGLAYQGADGVLVRTAGFSPVSELVGTRDVSHDKNADRKPVLVAGQQQGNRSAVLMGFSLSAQEQPGAMLWALLNPIALWGGVNGKHVETDYCVYEKGDAALFCSVLNEEGSNLLASQLDRTRNRGTIAFNVDDIPFRAAYWELFLAGEFAADPWVIAVVKPEPDIASAGQVFNAIFVPLTVFTLLLVTFISLMQIRSRIDPLDRLGKATRRIADGEFNSRVDVSTGDELEELADSLNTMAEKLGRQFSSLAVMAEIDRQILSSLNTDFIITTVLQRLADIAEHDWACLLIVDRNDPRAGMLYTLRDNNELTEFVVALPQSERTACEENPAGLIYEVETRLPEYLSPIQRMSHGQTKVIPILLKGKLSGVLCVGKHKGNLENASELLSSLADRLAVALGNAKWEEKLYHQAHHDDLTGLPNRALLFDRIEQAVRRADREKYWVAILFLDLDQFKTVNDSYGHGIGDQLLREVASRLQLCVREVDSVVRFAGDEFVIVLTDLGADQAALTATAEVSEKILAAVAEPLVLEERRFAPSASIGVAFYPKDAVSESDLLKNADAAMYQAKRTGRGNIEYYSRELNTAAKNRLALEQELKEAIEQDQFEVYFQPQIGVVGEVLSGAECLIRWMHPDKGMIAPFKFIPVAEEMGLIQEIGAQVLRNACFQAMEWRRRFGQSIRIAVNVSTREFALGDQFLASLDRIICETDMDTDLLELEVTEGALMQDIEQGRRLLQAIKALGIRLAIDDFGTGYSSLSYLKELPVDVLKIDRSFICDMLANPKSAAIVTSIIGLARSLDMAIVAEGVETREQVEWLRTAGCDHIQGFFYSRPVPPQEFEAFIQARAIPQVKQLWGS